MDTRTIRRTSVTLPSLHEPGLYLSNVTSLEGGRGRVAEFHYADADLRDLDLSDTHLMDGRITGLKAQRARLEKLRVDSVEFTGCDLASLHWTDSKISRAVFRDCKLMGATLEDVTLDNVLFENCKLDYSTLTRVRAAGPVIFSKCSLRETTFTSCDLGAALIDDCDLRLTEFDGGKYRGLDLRGNDLSQLRSLASLKQIVIDQSQTLQLAEALAAELDVTFGEDLDGR
ncbi:pentapeptide repeat-containing protein [Streptomyces sp. NPDC059894]|uniref:pentapeptide repeat-containing protein n=1 Tax=unclassified Streptomyces TaxID=2593676 RepID=UPI00364A7B1B